MKKKQTYLALAKLDDYRDVIVLKNTLGHIDWTPLERSGADAFKIWNGYLKGGFPVTAHIISKVIDKTQHSITVFDEDNIRIDCGDSGTFTDVNQYISIERYNYVTAKDYKDFPLIY
jgi:hypothetical protein